MMLSAKAALYFLPFVAPISVWVAWTVSRDIQIYELRRHPQLRAVAQRSGPGARADRQESERAPRGRGLLEVRAFQPLRASSRSRSR
jgi:hypothetical protein